MKRWDFILQWAQEGNAEALRKHCTVNVLTTDCILCAWTQMNLLALLVLQSELKTPHRPLCSYFAVRVLLWWRRAGFLLTLIGISAVVSSAELRHADNTGFSYNEALHDFFGFVFHSLKCCNAHEPTWLFFLRNDCNATRCSNQSVQRGSFHAERIHIYHSFTSLCYVRPLTSDIPLRKHTHRCPALLQHLVSTNRLSKAYS